MLDKLKQLFNLHEETPVDPAQELLLATAALLVEVSRANFDTSVDEKGQIVRLLASSFNLEDTAALATVEKAMAQVESAISLHPYTSLINQHYSNHEKLKIIKQMWQTALTDHHIDPFEEHTIRRVADLLHIPHSDFIRMKHWAEMEENHD